MPRLGLDQHSRDVNQVGLREGIKIGLENFEKPIILVLSLNVINIVLYPF